MSAHTRDLLEDGRSSLAIGRPDGGAGRSPDAGPRHPGRPRAPPGGGGPRPRRREGALPRPIPGCRDSLLAPRLRPVPFRPGFGPLRRGLRPRGTPDVRPALRGRPDASLSRFAAMGKLRSEAFRIKRVRRLLPLLILFAAALPAPGGGPLTIPYEMFRLPNGLTVIVHEDRSRPVVAVNLWYHVGSAREAPGRTGFAHLFEHIMFNGSENVPMGAFDQWLEGVGGDNNGSTSTRPDELLGARPVERRRDRALPRVRSDGLAPRHDDPERVNQQRDVVKNERRQSYENRPYGMAEILVGEALFPKDHPYHWPVIGYMDDLSAASGEDVEDFLPQLVRPGERQPRPGRRYRREDGARPGREVVRRRPRGPSRAPPVARPVVLTEEKRLVHEDQVDLPRLTLALGYAARLLARRRRAGRRRRRARRAGRTPASTGGSSTRSKSHRTCRPPRTRRSWPRSSRSS